MKKNVFYIITLNRINDSYYPYTREGNLEVLISCKPSKIFEKVLEREDASLSHHMVLYFGFWDEPVDLDEERNKTLMLPITVLDLSVLAMGCLKSVEGIKTLGDLKTWTPTKLLKIRRLGEGSLSQIRVELRKHGIELEKEND